MKKKITISVAVFMVLVTIGSAFALLPFKEKKEAYKKAETVFLNEENDDEINESNTVYQADCIPTDSVVIKSDKKLTSKNIGNYLSVESHLGDIPTDFSVEELSNGYYSVTPKTAMTEGLAYDFSTKNGATLVADGSEELTTVTKRIAKNESDIIDLKTGIVYLDWNDVEGDTAETITTINSEIAKDLKPGSVLCLMEGYDNWEKNGGTEEELSELYNDDTLFVRVEDVDSSSVAKNAEISVIDAAPEDVYEKVDVYVEEDIDAKDLLNLDELEAAIAESSGTKQMTAMLGAAIEQDETVQRLKAGDSEGSTSYFRNGVSYTNGKSISLGSKMLEGMSVTAKISANAENANFPVANPDGWSALEISIAYDLSVSKHVKVSAEVKITQYLNLSMQGGKTWDGSDLDFDYAMNMYSQTNFDVTVLVCSTAPDTGLKGNTAQQGSSQQGTNWFDISESIKEHLTEESSDSDNIVSQMNEMLDTKGDYIELVSVPIVQKMFEITPVLPIFAVNLKLDYVLKVNFAAGISSQLTVLDAVQIGMTGSNKGDNKGVKSYKYDLAGANRYSYDLYAAGYVGVKTGFKGRLTLSFIGLDDLGEIGIKIEVGAYVDCYGYLHFSLLKKYQFSSEVEKNFYGGYYIELGIYLEIGLIADSEIFNAKAEVLLLDMKFPLAHFGNQYIFYGLSGISDSGEFFMRGNSVPINDLLQLEGKYLDITTGELVVKPFNNVLDKSEITFSDEAFSLKDGNVTVNPDEVYKYTPPTGGSKVIIREHVNKTICTLKFKYNGPSLTGTDSGLTREYKIYWADSSTGITGIDDYNSVYNIGYALNLDGGETITLDTVENVEAGNSVNTFKLTDKEKRLYFVKDPSNPEKEYDYGSFCFTPSENTTYTLYAAHRQTYGAFVYYSIPQHSWVAEIRILNVGDSLEGPDTGTDMFTGWTETISGIKTACDTVNTTPVYDLIGHEPNEVVGSVTVSNYRDISEELNSFAEDKGINLTISPRFSSYNIPIDFSDIHIYTASYRDSNVTFYSGNGMQSSKKVPFGTTYYSSGYIPLIEELGVITGWDADNDGTADYTVNAEFPAAEEENILYRAVYGAASVNVKILSPNESGEYTVSSTITLDSDYQLTFGDNGTVTLDISDQVKKAEIENAFSCAKTDDFSRWQYSYQAFFKDSQNYEGASWMSCQNNMTIGYSDLLFRATVFDAEVNITASPDVPLYDSDGKEIGSFSKKMSSGSTILSTYANVVEGIDVPLYRTTNDGMYILKGWDTNSDGEIDVPLSERYKVVKGSQTLTPVYIYSANEYTITITSYADLPLTSDSFSGLVLTKEGNENNYTMTGGIKQVTALAEFVKAHLPADYVDKTTGKKYYYYYKELTTTRYDNEYTYQMYVYSMPYTYDVTLDANGGYFIYPSSNPTTASFNVENGTIKLGDYTSYANYTAVKDGTGSSYSVDYWEDSEGNHYTNDSIIDVQDNITLKAHWSVLCRISLKTPDWKMFNFSSNSGYYRTEDIMFISSGTHNVSELNSPYPKYDQNKYEYKITGWENEATKEFYGIDETFTVTEEPMTLIAKWELTGVGVGFQTDYFTGNIADGSPFETYSDTNQTIIVPVGKYKVSDFPETTPVINRLTFYTSFTGWKQRNTDSPLYKSGDEITITEPITFEAVYEQVEASVYCTFDAMGGTFNGSSDTLDKSFTPGSHKVGDTEDLYGFPNPVKEDEYGTYELIGWDIEVYDTDDFSTFAEGLYKVGETFDAPNVLTGFKGCRYRAYANAKWKMVTEKKHQLSYIGDESGHYQKCINDGCTYVSNIKENHTFTDGICTACLYKEKPVLNKDGFYEINNKGQLYSFAEMVNNGSYTINAVLNADIEFSEDDVWDSIGTFSYDRQTETVTVGAYKGIFDGQGHSISKLNCDNSFSGGLFGYLASPGVIKNIKLINPYVLGLASGGCVVGENGANGETGGLIENCHIYYGCPYCEESRGGYICGKHYSGIIRNCLIEGVDSYYHIVGIPDESAGTVENCYYLLYSDDKIEPGKESDSLEGTTSVTVDGLRNGSVAYLLRNGTNGSIWGHNDPEIKLEKDEEIFPSLGGNPVYRFDDMKCTDKSPVVHYTNDSTNSEKSLVYHNYENEWLTNKDEHYHYCKDCKKNIDAENHTSSGNATETEDEVCTVCGYVITPKLSHDFKNYSFDKTEHWQTCINDGCSQEQNREAHHFVDNVCDICGYTKNASHKLTILYQYENGDEAYETYFEDIEEGDSFNIASPEIKGYSADKTNVSGTMSNTDITVTVTYCDKSEINNFKSEITVDFKSTVILNAPVEDGENVAWFYENGTKICNGATLKIENIQSTVKVYSAKVDANGKAIEGTESKIETINVKSGFFDKLIAFFRGLFNLLPLWEDNSKK